MCYLMLKTGGKNRLFVLKAGYNDFFVDYVENNHLPCVR